MLFDVIKIIYDGHKIHLLRLWGHKISILTPFPTPKGKQFQLLHVTKVKITVYDQFVTKRTGYYKIFPKMDQFFRLHFKIKEIFYHWKDMASLI